MHSRKKGLQRLGLNGFIVFLICFTFAHMNYKKIGLEDLNYFKSILAENSVFADEATLDKFSRDETDGYRYLPEVVLKPNTVEEISAVM